MIPKPPPKTSPPNYAQVVAAFGEALYGSTWAAGVARLTGHHTRAIGRLAENARAGKDHAAAPAVLAAMYARLAPLVAQLEPWAKHAKD